MTDCTITQRETEVLQLIADGCSPIDIADRMCISPRTVKNHLGSIYQKFQVFDRTQAVLMALRMGLIHLKREEELA